MQEDLDQFQAKGAQVLAISVEDQKSGQDLKQSLHLTFPILSDPEALAINQYAGLDGGTPPRAKPATFVINRWGRVAWSYIGQNASDRPTDAMILEALDQL